MTLGRLDGYLARDDAGYILTGADLERWPGGPAGWPLPRRPLPLETAVMVPAPMAWPSAHLLTGEESCG